MHLDIGAMQGELALVNHATQHNIPLNGSFELTPVCNMNCDMCYVRLDQSDVTGHGGLLSVDDWLAIAEQMRDAGTLFLLLTGGEPLLYPGFKDLYLKLRRMGMILTVNTNATLIDEAWAEFFAANKPRRINVSLYGGNAEAYAKLCHYPDGFERTVNGIRLLREHGVDVRIGMSAVKANADDFDQIRALATELDAPLNVDTYMMPATREREKEFSYDARLNAEDAAALRCKAMFLGNTPEEAEQSRLEKLALIDEAMAHPVEAVPGEMGCLAGKCSFAVNWQGEMRPCVILTEPAISVLKNGFADAWKKVSEAVAAIRLCADCTACPRRSLCNTCAACALLEAGGYDRKPEYMCRYAEATERLLREM